MGLFSTKNETVPPAPVVEEKPKRTSTLFGRKQEPVPVATTTTSTHTGLLHRNKEDASISAARETLLNAEAAEREADRALQKARVAVREARERIKVLEREAKEEARLARIKQEQAEKMAKRGKGLGRHEHTV